MEAGTLSCLHCQCSCPSKASRKKSGYFTKLLSGKKSPNLAKVNSAKKQLFYVLKLYFLPVFIHFQPFLV